MSQESRADSRADASTREKEDVPCSIAAFRFRRNETFRGPDASESPQVPPKLSYAAAPHSLFKHDFSPLPLFSLLSLLSLSLSLLSLSLSLSLQRSLSHTKLFSSLLGDLKLRITELERHEDEAEDLLEMIEYNTMR